MKPINRQSTYSTEKELTKRLTITLISLVGATTLIILSLTIFAPSFASLFKIFSKNKDFEQVVIKPSKPVFTIENNYVNTESILLKGYAKEGNTINLYVNGPKVNSTIVGLDGIFVFNNVNVISGRNTIFARAVDGDGNESDESDTLFVTLDKDSPKLEIESPKNDEVIKNLDSRITIKGKVNEKSSIVINDKVAILKPDLSFEHLIGVEQGEVKIVINVTDDAGNQTKEDIKIEYKKSGT